MANTNGQASPQKSLKPWRMREYSVIQRSVGWDEDFDHFVWSELCSLRKDRSLATGIRWSIDHLIPLRGRAASGLHVAQNWQLIPLWMNTVKGNQMLLAERDEWLNFVGFAWLPSWRMSLSELRRIPEPE